MSFTQALSSIGKTPKNRYKKTTPPQVLERLCFDYFPIKSRTAKKIPPKGSVYLMQIHKEPYTNYLADKEKKIFFAFVKELFTFS